MELVAIAIGLPIVAIAMGLCYLLARQLHKFIPFVPYKLYLIPVASMSLIFIFSFLVFLGSFIGLAISLTIQYLCYRKRQRMIHEHFERLRLQKLGGEHV